MKRHYINWTRELGRIKLSNEDLDRIHNSVEVEMLTDRGWVGIAVCWTQREAEAHIEQVRSGKIRYKYPHKMEFRIR